jgi:serine/threonine protein kinase
VASGVDQALAKFVPKTPGADRELLLAGLDGVCNVVPVIDSGEHEDNWVIVMPRADLSLRHYLEASGTPSIEESVVILDDSTAALADLDGKVVHRDLKPENVLRLDGRWWRADFGISRYGEASIARTLEIRSLAALRRAGTLAQRARDKRRRHVRDPRGERGRTDALGRVPRAGGSSIDARRAGGGLRQRRGHATFADGRTPHLDGHGLGPEVRDRWPVGRATDTSWGR